MSEEEKKANNPLGGRFQAFGASLRQSAQDMTAKAAAQVNEMNKQMERSATADGHSPAPAANGDAAGASPPAAATPTNLQNADKKDLLELLQKMNKKVKALTVIRQQLTTKTQDLEQEKNQLSSFVTDEILNGHQVDGNTDLVPQLQMAWRQQDEQSNIALQQLQKEFQSLQQQASSSGDGGSNNADWEIEKKELLQKHETELAQIKKQQQHQQPNESEIKKVKEAAAAQLQAFKKKVATARSAEITKVKTEAAAAAKKVLEAKIDEQRIKYEEQLQALEQASSDGKGADAVVAQLREQLQTQQAKYAEELARLDEKKSSSSSSSDELLEQQRKEHESELQAIKVEAERNCQAAGEAQNKFETLQQEFERMKTSLGSTVESLKEQLAEASALAKEPETQATSEAGKDFETARQELESAHGKERKQMLEQFAKEKEALRLDFQQKWNNATATNQEAAAKRQQEAVQKVSDQFRTKFEELKKGLEEKKAEEINKFRAEWKESADRAQKETSDEATFKLQSLKAELDAQVSGLKRQLQHQARSLEDAQSRERTSQVELEQAKSLLDAARSGQEDSSKALDDALAKQKSSYEKLLEDQKQQGQSAVSALQKDVQDLTKARDEALSEANATREELTKADQAASSETKRIQERLSRAETSKAEAIQTLKASHEASLSTVSRQMEEKEAELVSLRSAGGESSEDFAKLQSEYKELQTELERAKEQARADYEKAQSDIKLASERSEALQKELSESKTVLEELEAAKNALSEARSRHEKELTDVRRTLQVASGEDLQKQIAAAREQANTEKDSEISSLKSIYEARLQEAAKKEETVAQTFNEVKVAYAQKMKKTADEAAEKVARLEQEKSELVKSANEAARRLEEIRSNESERAELKKSDENKMKLEVEEKSTLLASLQNDVKEALEARSQAESRVARLEKELEAARTEAPNASGIEELQKQIDTRLEEANQVHAEQLRTMEANHHDALQKLKAELAEQDEATEAVARLGQEKAELARQLEKAKQTAEEEKASMRKMMEAHVDKMTTQFKEKLEVSRSKAAEELTVAQRSSQEKDVKLSKLLEKLKALTASSTKLRDENDSLKKRVESEAAAQKTLQSQLEGAKKQLDETISNSSATASSLLKQQETLEKEKSELERRAKTLQAELQVKSNKVEELSGKLDALSGNLNALTEDQRVKDEKLEHASKQEAKLKSSEAEVADLREQINKLKLEGTKNATLVEKLQGEKEANERNHGQRTAMVGMLETQLSEMSDKNADINAKLEAALYDLSQKDELLHSNIDQVQKLEKDLEDAKSAAKRSSEALVAAQKGADSKSNKIVESLQKELQSMKQQMARKSSAAQRLLQQREAECAELRKANKGLQHEVDKGSYSDRRIFELAALQSNRESHQVSEIEVRDSIIERLKEALVERDGDLASAEKHAQEVESQIEELFRIRRREDINIDYLKSIIVQYLSLPPGSTERAGLLPVLATLLQFDVNDYKTIEEGKNRVSWWGSSVIPKLINAPSGPAPPASPSGSAEGRSSEVLVSSASAASTGKRTSLQF